MNTLAHLRPYDVLFFNDEYVAVQKSANVLCVPSQNPAEKRIVLSHDLRTEFGTILPIHRLDADTWGIVIFARNAAAQRDASIAFEDHSVRKVYHAVSTSRAIPNGSIDKQDQEFSDHLVRGKKRSFIAPHGKLAHTNARVFPFSDAPLGFAFETSVLTPESEKTQDWLAWVLTPTTGRTHQLRVQLASRGFPILGDKLYGGPDWASNAQGHALCSVQLDFRGCPSLYKRGLEVLSVPPLSIPI